MREYIDCVRILVEIDGSVLHRSTALPIFAARIAVSHLVRFCDPHATHPTPSSLMSRTQKPSNALYKARLTASLMTLSPITVMARVGSTLRQPKVQRVATGSIALIRAANASAWNKTSEAKQ